MPLNTEELTAYVGQAEATGLTLAADVTPESLVGDLLTGTKAALEAESVALSRAETAEDELERVRAELLAAKQEAETVALSRGNQVDPAVATSQDDITRQYIDLGVARHEIPVPIADGLKARMANDGTVTLSRTVTGDAVIPIRDVVKMFAGLNLSGVTAGEQTGAQTVTTLARQTDEPADPAKVTAERLKALRDMAGVAAE